LTLDPEAHIEGVERKYPLIDMELGSGLGEYTVTREGAVYSHELRAERLLGTGKLAGELRGERNVGSLVSWQEHRRAG